MWAGAGRAQDRVRGALYPRRPDRANRACRRELFLRSGRLGSSRNPGRLRSWNCGGRMLSRRRRQCGPGRRGRCCRCWPRAGHRGRRCDRRARNRGRGCLGRQGRAVRLARNSACAGPLGLRAENGGNRWRLGLGVPVVNTVDQGRCLQRLGLLDRYFGRRLRGWRLNWRNCARSCGALGLRLDWRAQRGSGARPCAASEGRPEQRSSATADLDRGAHGRGCAAVRRSRHRLVDDRAALAPERQFQLRLGLGLLPAPSSLVDVLANSASLVGVDRAGVGLVPLNA